MTKDKITALFNKRIISCFFVILSLLSGSVYAQSSSATSSQEADSTTSKNSVSKTNSTPSTVIYFHWEKYDLDEHYYPFLNSVAAIMKVNSSMKLMINGFTDNMGENDYNKNLSEMRAKSVANYLFHLGVKRSRIKYKGLGASQFIAPNDGENNHRNRRVEVLFVK